jgi:UDP-N-acetylglucosamine--N-acetylmuramyl-(pentapeptide) pyrophosphoryl-undecaprenol N-acetylglucosamine transferase
LASHKVYFAVFGSGLGHVTRILEVSKSFPEAEYRFRYSSSGQGYSFLETAGMRGSAVRSPSLDVEWAVGGGFSSHRVLPSFPFMFNKFLRQVAFERESIRRFDPGVVVSDSRLSAVFAGKSESYPVVTMLNQFKVLFPPRFRNSMGRQYERIAGDSLGLMWSLSDKILLTDLPPPYTIAEENVVGSEVSNIVEFVGFTAPKVRSTPERLRRVKASLGMDRRSLVFCQVSGPEATKGRFVDTVLASAEQISRECNLVVSLGRSGGSTTPSRLAGGGWLFEWCPVKDELFELSSALVARAGHSTIGQCIDHAKPAVLVPIHNHPEQIGNAEKFSSMGLGVAIRSEKLTPEILAGAVESCLTDSSFRERIGAVSAVSNRYDGVARCAEVIRSYA